MPDLSNIYAHVTAKIVADLEQGVRPWHKPWQDRPGAELPLRHNGIPYKGINVLILWSESLDKGYANRIWMTFNQAVQLGSSVEKDNYGVQVVFSTVNKKIETDDQGNDVRHGKR